MGKANIPKKCVMKAREAARRDSKARITGKSVYVKRCPSGYTVIGVNVTKKQRTCRDMFADAQKLASYELKQWNKKRHWAKEAKRHKIRGAHRMAVSYFYRMLKEHGDELLEIRPWREEDRQAEVQRVFYLVNFDSVEEYREELFRLCG